MTEVDRESAGAGFLRNTQYLNDLRAQMLKFATLQLADPGLAEDAVQEALIGALRNVDSFTGGSAFKTWVFAILKNKIIDLLRKQRHTVSAGNLQEDEDSTDETLSTLFNARGHWHLDERPEHWGDPEKSLQDGHFWRIFEACLEHLPPRQAKVFMQREFIGLDTEEICQASELSISNLHVLLHRARLRLRRCLEDNWFLERAG
jgi:RNA polymerase sigma-70 factor (ECF subfamily)